jgi:hypothetical protein
MNAQTISKFLNFVTDGYDSKNYWELRTISKEGEVNSEFFPDVGAIKNFIELNKEKLLQLNVYIGINPRIKKGRGDENVNFSNILFVDLDSEKSIQDCQQIYQQLSNDLNLRPSLIVNSGHGIHLYFKMDKLIDSKEWVDLQIKLIEFFKKHFSEYNPDDKIKNPERIMRLIGSNNVKKEPIETALLIEDYTVNKSIDLKLFLSSFKKKEFTPTSTTIPELTKELSQEQVHQLSQLLTPLWIEQYRNNLTMDITGMLMKEGYRLSSILELIQKVCLEAGDEEFNLRMKTVMYHEKKEDVSKLLGSSGLFKEIFDILQDEEKTKKVLNNIKGIINSNPIEITKLDLNSEIEKLNRESSFERGINEILKQTLMFTPGEQEEIINKISGKTGYKKNALRKQLIFFGKEKHDIKESKTEEVWTPALDDESFKILHPAIDFSTDVCYIGTRIPCRSSSSDKIKLKHVLVSEKGEILPLNSKTLEEKHIELETEPMDIKSRWSFGSINDFIRTPKIVEGTNITEVFNIIKGQLEYYIYFEKEDIGLYDVLTCWIIGTYFFKLFGKYSYFQLKGVPGSGKSKTAKIVGWLSFNGKLGLKYSESSIFRRANSTRGTMIIDENEGLGSRSEKKANIEDLLNSGFESGFSVPRVERIKEDGVEKFITIDYDVFCPKFIANIKGISKVATSERTIEGTMVKCGKKEQGTREPEESDSKWQSTRDKLYYCVFKYWRTIKEGKDKLRISLGKDISSRDLDIWLPILTIANLVDPSIFNSVMKTAKELIESKKVDIAEKSDEARLLQVLLKKEIFEEIFKTKLSGKGYASCLDDDPNKTPRYYIKDIVNYLTGVLGWNPEYNTERSIGRKITTLKCFVKKGNDGNGIWYKFTSNRLQEIKESFGWEFEEEKKNES